MAQHQMLMLLLVMCHGWMDGGPVSTLGYKIAANNFEYVPLEARSRAILVGVLGMIRGIIEVSRSRV